MSLHPQIAGLASQMEELASLLRAHGDRRWSGRVERCAHLVADSNFAGVERFLRLFGGEEGLEGVTLQGDGANASLGALCKATRTLAERLAREEGGLIE